MEASLLAQGVELMLAGMGVVFVFLSVLVGATALMSQIVMRFLPTASTSDSEQEIAAIAAAIARHRSKRDA